MKKLKGSQPGCGSPAKRKLSPGRNPQMPKFMPTLPRKGVHVSKVEEVVNRKGNLITIWVRKPYPTIRNSWINSSPIQSKGVKRNTKNRVQHLTIPSIVTHKISKSEILKINIYVEINWLVSQRGFETSRIVKKKGTVRIDGSDPQVGLITAITL